MRNKELRVRLKKEFDSVVPDVLDKIMDDSLVNQPAFVSKPTSKTFFTKRALSFSCALAFVFILGISFNNVYQQVSASISIDINPSISIDINRFDRVLKVSAHNAEAQAIISNLKLNNSSADSAINQILLSAQSKGYIINTSTDNAILFSVWSNDTNEAGKLEDSIQLHVRHCVNSNNINSEIRFENVDTDTYHHAQTMNVSSGKIKLIDDIIQYDDSFDENELLSKPVNELFGVYDRCRNEHSRGHGGNGHGYMGGQNYTEPPQSSLPVPDTSTQNTTPQKIQEPIITPVPATPNPQIRMQPRHGQNGHMNGGGMMHGMEHE